MKKLKKAFALIFAASLVFAMAAGLSGCGPKEIGEQGQGPLSEDETSDTASGDLVVYVSPSYSHTMAIKRDNSLWG